MNDRKTYFLLFVGVCILFLGGGIFKFLCGIKKNNNEISPVKQYTSEDEKDRYEVNPDKYYFCEKVKDGYEISLYNNLNQKIYSEVYPIEPTIRPVKENVLEISISVGSPASYNFYFDIERFKISDTFFNSFFVGDNYIAYMYNEELILRDAFDKDTFYMTITRDFTKTANPMSAIISIELVEQENVKLRYFKGEDYVEIIEIIELKN